MGIRSRLVPRVAGLSEVGLYDRMSGVSDCLNWLLEASSIPFAMEICEARAVRDLVSYATETPDTVEEVLEFQVAKALLDGRMDLSARLPSQWGDVGLFELCLSFGLLDTAWALAERVPGCVLDLDHLGSYAEVEPQVHGIDAWEADRCRCDGRESRESCEYCCFGFQIPKGVWMRDAHADLEAARKAANRRWLRRIVPYLKLGHALPLTLTPKAIARLLDMAVLTGDAEAAGELSKRCEVWPLRRYRAQDLFRRTPVEGVELVNPALVLAALAAGVDFTLFWKGEWEPLPFRVAVALSGQRWSHFASFLPPTTWVPEPENDVVPYLFRPQGQHCVLSESLLREAMAAGLELWRYRRSIYMPGHEVILSLLEVAIICGQADCAVLCADSEAPSLQKRHLEGDDLGFSPGLLAVAQATERRAAAVAAAMKLLDLNWRRARGRGVAIFQAFKRLQKGPCPAFLVDLLLAYTVDMPPWVHRLGLYEVGTRLTGPLRESAGG